MRRGEHGIWLRTSGGAFAYAGVLFLIHFVAGPLRAMQIDPALGSTAGAVIESGLFMPVILFGGVMIPAVFRLTGSSKALLAFGLTALIPFLIADIAVGITFCGLSAGEHLSRFRHAAGWIQGGTLAAFALFPWLWWRADGAGPDRFGSCSGTRSQQKRPVGNQKADERQGPGRACGL